VQRQRAFRRDRRFRVDQFLIRTYSPAALAGARGTFAQPSGSSSVTRYVELKKRPNYIVENTVGFASAEARRSPVQDAVESARGIKRAA
jgi:hypothetical protein